MNKIFIGFIALSIAIFSVPNMSIAKGNGSQRGNTARAIHEVATTKKHPNARQNKGDKATTKKQEGKEKAIEKRLDGKEKAIERRLEGKEKAIEKHEGKGKKNTHLEEKEVRGQKGNSHNAKQPKQEKNKKIIKQQK